MHLTIPVLVLLVDLSFGKENVSWKLLTKTVVFGQAAQLVCHLPKHTCCHKYTRSWRSGSNYKLLTLNEWSSNYTKYTEQLDTENRTSVLTIKSISVSEVDIIYQCSYGFSNYDAILQFTKHRYEYHPETLVPVTLSVNRTHIYAIITLEKVFPKPQCYAHDHEKDITKESLNVKSHHNGLLYRSIVDFKYLVDSQHHCVGLVTITCAIGTANTTIAKHMFSCRHNGSPPQGRHLAQTGFDKSSSNNEQSNIIGKVLIFCCFHFIKFISLITF